ncbi:MAG: hypothetical protein KR126chlam3_01604, partial [Chlamydiae bacterium]|nr:hypothetical protein [Chlamydiota bacterium]
HISIVETSFSEVTSNNKFFHLSIGEMGVVNIYVITGIIGLSNCEYGDHDYQECVTNYQQLLKVGSPFLFLCCCLTCLALTPRCAPDYIYDIRANE